MTPTERRITMRILLLWVLVAVVTQRVSAEKSSGEARRLQIPGIFDLSVGAQNQNDNDNDQDNNSDNESPAPSPEPATAVPTIAPVTDTPTLVPTVEDPNKGGSFTYTDAPVTTDAPVSTPAPTPASPGLSSSYTSSGRGTNFPTLPISLVDLPATVDIQECRKHLQIADEDRNNWLKERESMYPK